MKVILLAGFIVAVFLIFPGKYSLGAAPNQRNGVAQNQKGKNNAPARKPPQRNNSRNKQNSKKPKSQQQRFKEQQAKQLEQRRKQEQAEAARRKELETQKNRRLASKTTTVMKEIGEVAQSLTVLEYRLQKANEKRKSLGEAIRLVRGKAEGKNLSEMKSRLERMGRDWDASSEGSQSLANDLAKVKAACSKWKGSGSAGKQGSAGKKGSASPNAFGKLEEEALRIKRDCSRVEYELKKDEARCKSSTDILFLCVGELVRAGVSFSKEEKDSIRALSN